MAIQLSFGICGNQQLLQFSHRRVSPVKAGLSILKAAIPTRLKNAIQGSGWCIATQHYAESYLERGDVYIYFDGKAQVAMHVDPGYQTYRADDDRPSGGYALEIFERYNHPVASYAAEVIEYTEANGIDIDEHTSGYEGLQQALEINQKLDTDPAYASNFRHEIYNDPGMFDYLTRERKKTREYRKAYTDAMLKQLQYASNAGSLTATIENIDNDILQENEEAFTQAAKYALKQSESWFDTFRLLHNDEAHRLVRKLMQEPEVVDKIKRLYIKRKREEQYHTTGQGDDDRSETITRWLQEDPAFYEAVKSELIGRLGQPKTVEGGNIYPRQAAFILTENNELLNKDPEIRALMEQKVLTYVSNNPDVADATKREMYHYKSRNDAFELPLEDAQYDAIVNNVDNWLWLLSPNHPRNSGKDYWTVGLSSTIEQNFSQSDERHRIDALINNSAAATSPHLILSHPNWPPYQRIPLSHIVWEIPENLRQDPRIQQRVSALITPAWQKSLNTTLQEPKEGQPFNPYDNGNRDMMKMIHRYCEMILLDGAGMTNTPEMQHTIQEHYRNPQFLYGMVRHAKTHLDATSLEDALDKMSLKNSPMPRDPEILEAVQLFRKEEAKKFIQGMYHYSFDSRAQNDAPGIDVHHLMNMQGVEPPKSQIIRDSVGSGWSNIAKDLQGDPEVQQFFTDRFGDTLRGIMEQSVPSEGNRYRRMSPLRSIDVVPEYMWQQEGFKENEKLMWVKALDRGQLINSVVYKSEDQEAWYPLAAATIWNAVPDHLKTDEDIQKAMENCLKRLITSVFQEYRVGTLEEASEAIVHAVAVHEEMMPEGSTWESPSWRSTPFRNTLKSHLDTRVINNFIAAIRVIELMYQNLSQAGYQSRYLKWLIERCQDAEQQWLWVKQDVERLHQQERDKFRLEDVFPEAGAGAPQQVQPPPQYGINPAQASSWLLRAVEAHVVKAFDQSAAA